MDIGSCSKPEASLAAYPRRSRLGPLIIGCGLLMQGFDATAITVALPAMAHSLHTDPLALNLAISFLLLGVGLSGVVHQISHDRTGGWQAKRSDDKLLGCGDRWNQGNVVGHRAYELRERCFRTALRQ